MRARFFVCPLVLMLGALAMGQVFAGTEFDLTDTLVPVEEILPGGPAKDGIPALDMPRFVSSADARHTRAGDAVLGLALDGVAKAYPIRILNWHEVVNDRFGARSVVVTYCPLCGSGMAFESNIGGRELGFGVSGLLYNSDVLLYDRQTESLWSQILGKALSGPRAGTVLEAIPLVHTTWADWLARHPDTQVLSDDTGHQRDYARDPYAGYVRTPNTYFPVRFRAQGFHPKERVLGLVLNGEAKAWPFAELSKSPAVIDDTLAGQAIRIRFNSEHQSAEVFDQQGAPLAGVTLYWFSWYAFHPETEVWRAQP